MSHFPSGIPVPFLCLVSCQVLWVQWCSLGWWQSRRIHSCTMFSSWYALPTPLQLSYMLREGLSPGRCPQKHGQCQLSFICFCLFCEIFTPDYKWFCFLNRCLNVLGHSSTVCVQYKFFINYLGLSLFFTSYSSIYPESVWLQPKSQFCGSFIFKIKPRY